MPIFLGNKLKHLSSQIRLDVLEMCALKGGHIGGSLSAVEILVSVYFSGLFKLPKSYDFSSDKFILSAGHVAPVLYATLAQYGSFPRKQLLTYSDFGSPLQGHSNTETPGVLFSAGSLGQGLSFASGLALADPKHQVVCLTSDGEHQEGQIWEAVAFANKYKLKNLINIIDHNKYQIDGSTNDIMPLEDLGKKYLSFGWSVYEVDGHDTKKIIKVLSLSKKLSAPVCIIAHTTLGKGVSFMHYDYHYHDIKSLPPELYTQAKRELTLQSL